VAAFTERLGTPLTPEQAGKSVTELVTGSYELTAYLLTAAGLAPVP
jgi:hypothetical protein